MQSFTLPAYAKINWFLRILGKRDDNFHELETAFQTVSLRDELKFSPADELILEGGAPGVPLDETNLILCAAKLLREKYQTTQGARIRLEKRIPSPGGLGGGSSDAAIALLGLNKLWNLQIPFGELRETAAQIGSDAPFFLYGGTAFGRGRGTEIFPAPNVEEKYLLIVTPAVSVPTKDAFARLNATRLTNSGAKSNLELCQNQPQNGIFGQSEPINDFEKSVFEIAPEIKRVKQTLHRAGAKIALMTGSGASVYAVFEKEETRQATLKALEVEINWRKFAVATVSREQYRADLKVVSDSF